MYIYSLNIFLHVHSSWCPRELTHISKAVLTFSLDCFLIFVTHGSYFVSSSSSPDLSTIMTIVTWFPK